MRYFSQNKKKTKIQIRLSKIENFSEILKLFSFFTIKNVKVRNKCFSFLCGHKNSFLSPMKKTIFTSPFCYKNNLFLAKNKSSRKLLEKKRIFLQNQFWRRIQIFFFFWKMIKKFSASQFAKIELYNLRLRRIKRIRRHFFFKQ